MALRVIQSNNNGTVSNIGDYCYSGIKSFRDADPTEARETLFIHKQGDRVEASLFQSTLWDTNTEGGYVFRVSTTPRVVDITDTPYSHVHLMSTSALKEQVVAHIKGV